MAETTGIIEQYAAHLEAKASRVVLRMTASFGLLGALLGGFPLLYTKYAIVPSHMGYATLLLGAGAGAYLGYTFGDRRAEEHRMQAKLALHQLQVEQSLMRQVAAAARPAVQQPVVQQPQPQFQQPVVPVQVQQQVQQPVPVPVAMPAPVPVAPPPVAPAPVAPAPVAPAPVAPAPVAPAPVAPAPVAPAPVAPAPV